MHCQQCHPQRLKRHLLQAHASRAFRFGVRLAQLEVAMNAHDTASVSRATLQLQQLLHDVQGSAPLSSRLEAMGRQFDFGTASERRVLWSQLRTMLGAGEWFDLGSWSGAAQLAALNGQQAYFASDGQALHALTSVLASPAVPADAWDAVTRPLHSLQHGTEPDASQVRDIATMLAGVFASAGG